MDFRRYLRLPPHLAVFAVLVLATSAGLSALCFFAGIMGIFVAFWVLPVVALFAMGIFLFHLFKGAGRPDQREAAVVLLAAPIAFAAVFWITGVLCLWATFGIRYQGYRHVIALAEQGRLPPEGKAAWQFADDGTQFQAERASPNRIAFPLPGGFLNEWQGILYDPHGIGQHPAKPQKDGKIEDLLDDWYTVEACTHMIGRFYRCSFS